MKSGWHGDERYILDRLKREYAIPAVGLELIPFGDSAYSYSILCSNGSRYYMKLCDLRNGRQQAHADRMDRYLPLLSEMGRHGSSPRTVAPIPNGQGNWKSTWGDVSTALFPFVEGDTLAEAYPLSKEWIARIAETAAEIHLLIHIPKLRELAAEEDYDLSFAPRLLEAIGSLESGRFDDRCIGELQRLILPLKERLIGLVRQLEKTRQALGVAAEKVLCHGDLWDGNLLIDRRGEMIVLDWESAVIAPPERELFGYMDQEFDTFYAHYCKRRGHKVVLHSDLLRFYGYRHHLRNLTNWMMNIMYWNSDAAQQENDLEMIAEHCLNLLDGIEEGVRSAERVCSA